MYSRLGLQSWRCYLSRSASVVIDQLVKRVKTREGGIPEFAGLGIGSPQYSTGAGSVQSGQAWLATVRSACGCWGRFEIRYGRCPGAAEDGADASRAARRASARSLRCFWFCLLGGRLRLSISSCVACRPRTVGPESDTTHYKVRDVLPAISCTHAPARCTLHHLTSHVRPG